MAGTPLFRGVNYDQIDNITIPPAHRAAINTMGLY